MPECGPFDQSPEARASRNVPHHSVPVCPNFVAQPEPAEFWCTTCHWNRPDHGDERFRTAVANELKRRGTPATNSATHSEENRHV